ncbi:GMC oxidoreductase [Mycena pura]|uniref:GMC oxidoreductase n=1 Tax=Mycena pura TaxID=153505 RepID=A0AAD6VIM4_9AGAR|nr:GMC oxidoreductase [Mycena pura]
MSPFPTRAIHGISSKPYTYIVVGGGTAGCVLAARLSEDPDTTVLLLERGPVADGWAASVPLISSNFTDQKAPVYKWESAPLSGVDGKRLTMFTGKALGGSSKINGLLYTRSVPGEYNAWKAAGRRGWGWESVKGYFEKSETSSVHASYRGTSGPWKTRPVDEIRFKSVTSTIEVAPSLNIPYIPNCNDPASPVVACTRLDATIDDKGHRSSTADAFLPKKLVQQRKNLHICTGAVVSSLIIRDHKVLGVNLESDSDTSTSPKRYQAFAHREVVLCAGAISTPQILLLSGIGPEDHLRQHKIHLVKHLPGVGAHLVRGLVPIIYKVPVTDSVEILLKKPLTSLRELLSYFFKGKGIFATQVQQANIVLRTALLNGDTDVAETREEALNEHDPANVPDLEIMLIPVNPTVRKFDGVDKDKSVGTFSYLCTVLRPKSVGSVRLVSTNARDQPLCDLGTLSNAEDRGPLRQVLRVALSLALNVRSRGYPLQDLLVPASTSNDDLDAFIAQNLTTTYHYSSSCRMAAEADAGVVDDELRVHGVSGLRIADASIFPQIPACHLQAPVVMVAERCADFLKCTSGA